MLQNAIETLPSEIVWNQYISCCWIKAADARKWFEAQGLSPPNVICVTEATLPSNAGASSTERSIEVAAMEPSAVESVSTSPCCRRSRWGDRGKRQTIEQAITTLKIDPSSAKPADVATRIWGESGKRQDRVLRWGRRAAFTSVGARHVRSIPFLYANDTSVRAILLARSPHLRISRIATMRYSVARTGCHMSAPTRRTMKTRQLAVGSRRHSEAHVSGPRLRILPRTVAGTHGPHGTTSHTAILRSFRYLVAGERYLWC